MKFWKYFAFTFLILQFLLTACQSADELHQTTTPQEQESGQNMQEIATVTTVASPAEDEPWSIVRQIEIENAVSMAAFMNQDFGIRSCSSSEDRQVYHTSDGGQSWMQSKTSPG